MLKNRNIPFGYCVINGKYALNSSEAEAVRNIFNDYINGKSLKTIADEMAIPYNTSKTLWNKNMVCRVLENRKYIGDKNYPPVVTKEEFEKAALVKTERTTYRKPAPKEESKQAVTVITEYAPTEEIQRMTNEINRLLDSENPDKEKAESFIIKCAQSKYSAIKEVNME